MYHRNAAFMALCLCLVATGCVSVPMAPGAENVRFTRVAADVSNCKAVGNVDHATGAVVANQVIGFGGNTVFDTTDSLHYALGDRADTGIIYRCDPPLRIQPN